ncbi:response regulator transcription factor [Halomonas litopenaei]|uniref:response regulator transcription factor n=1 Tax=Halomonas litopenaei TaxID=2109328 RepID=UPI001A8F9092|nr:response regulator transcription factor [Halomonas litopenaei]MBN8411469.1 response regulator transcription factor [Halomonas litopenaei]
MLNNRILIVEDEVDIARLLKSHLDDLGADVALAHDAGTGMRLALECTWDLALLDIQLPGVHNGLGICEALRHKSPMTVIMMLTARSSELNRLTGFEHGADDYVVKPFSIIELVARIKSQLRRLDMLKSLEASHAGTPPPVQLPIEVGQLRIHPDYRRAAIKEQNIELTSKEFDLLLFFASAPNRVFSRAELLDKVWGYGHAGYEHTVNSHINRLRSKIEADTNAPRRIITVWGVGYKLDPDGFAEH